MKKQEFVHKNASLEALQQEAHCRGMGCKGFTITALVFLAGMTVLYPYALHRLLHPVIYPYVRESLFAQELAETIVIMAWFFPLFWFESWFLDKRSRMQAAQAELTRRQKDGAPLQ